MRLIAASAIAAAALAGAPALAQSPVVGDWATVAETPQGTFEAVLHVTEADGAYMVEFEEAAPGGGPPMESEISNVVVDGDSISFTRTLASPQGDFELSYAGTVDGDTLSATATSSFGEIPVTGTRQ